MFGAWISPFSYESRLTKRALSYLARPDGHPEQKDLPMSWSVNNNDYHMRLHLKKFVKLWQIPACSNE
jgi:hypothetical protein